eukprot:TRINITY_DN971_c0_g3_i1.p1 TRINITY_DN971_c0_g3~~TRINITY_DN971_c0_g3_i1.p1  ORF type:complete len:1104 (+),score=174.99 TRINITY_DN971_c0_g3_i1:411-3722(+)
MSSLLQQGSGNSGADLLRYSSRMNSSPKELPLPSWGPTPEVRTDASWQQTSQQSSLYRHDSLAEDFGSIDAFLDDLAYSPRPPTGSSRPETTSGPPTRGLGSAMSLEDWKGSGSMGGSGEVSAFPFRLPLETAEHSEYTAVDCGVPNSLTQRFFFLTSAGQEASPWHTIPLKPEGFPGLVNCVCRTPSGSRAVLELARDGEPFTPLKPATFTPPTIPSAADFANQSFQGRSGSEALARKTRLLFSEPAPCNIGFLPQTRAAKVLGEINWGYSYDSTALEVLDVGRGKTRKVGDVYMVKVVGAIPLVEGVEQKLSWKLLAVAADDARAAIVDEPQDLAGAADGQLTLEMVRRWLRCRFASLPGVPPGHFPNGGEAHGSYRAATLTDLHHEAWRVHCVTIMRWVSRVPPGTPLEVASALMSEMWSRTIAQSGLPKGDAWAVARESSWPRKAQHVSAAQVGGEGGRGLASDRRRSKSSIPDVRTGDSGLGWDGGESWEEQEQHQQQNLLLQQSRQQQQQRQQKKQQQRLQQQPVQQQQLTHQDQSLLHQRPRQVIRQQSQQEQQQQHQFQHSSLESKGGGLLRETRDESAASSSTPPFPTFQPFTRGRRALTVSLPASDSTILGGATPKSAPSTTHKTASSWDVSASPQAYEGGPLSAPVASFFTSSTSHQAAEYASREGPAAVAAKRSPSAPRLSVARVSDSRRTSFGDGSEEERSSSFGSTLLQRQSSFPFGPRYDPVRDATSAALTGSAASSMSRDFSSFIAFSDFPREPERPPLVHKDVGSVGMAEHLQSSTGRRRADLSAPPPQFLHRPQHEEAASMNTFGSLWPRPRPEMQPSISPRPSAEDKKTEAASAWTWKWGQKGEKGKAEKSSQSAGGLSIGRVGGRWRSAEYRTSSKKEVTEPTRWRSAEFSRPGGAKGSLRATKESASGGTKAPIPSRWRSGEAATVDERIAEEKAEGKVEGKSSAAGEPWRSTEWETASKKGATEPARWQSAEFPRPGAAKASVRATKERASTWGKASLPPRQKSGEWANLADKFVEEKNIVSDGGRWRSAESEPSRSKPSEVSSKDAQREHRRTRSLNMMMPCLVTGDGSGDSDEPSPSQL